MARANPRQLGFSICQFCSGSSVRISNGPLLLRTICNSTRRSLPRTLPLNNLTARWTSTAAAHHGQAPGAPVPSTPAATTVGETKDPAQLARTVEGDYQSFLSGVEDIPDAQLTKKTLMSCLSAAATLHPQLRRAKAQTQASASRLALLNAERTGSGFAIDTALQEASDRISHNAYNVINHPNVEMTPENLELYVHIQAELGRPESLPHVLGLYAHKAKPIVKDGKVQYVPQNPNGAAKAIEKPVADVALQTAIDAKNLDAALGITDAAFCVQAFKRQKLLKQASAPALGLASLPFGIFGLSTAYAAYWQNTMDMSTATGVGIAGISGYFFVVGSLGVIAKLSAKDQMRRVTWLPGTPLRYRWMREEEREALDKIACSWGFKESWRHGEESGPEWEGLREHMGYRQMLLDRVEFMEGMN